MKNFGFTLIEVLVVISLTAILVALAPNFYKKAFQETHDSKRKNDLKQYQTALESWSTNNESLYPLAQNTVAASATLCPLLENFISKCLEDEKFSGDSSYTYQYQSSANRTKWVLWAKLDNETYAWVTCSNRKSGKVLLTSIVGLSGGECPF